MPRYIDSNKKEIETNNQKTEQKANSSFKLVIYSVIIVFGVSVAIDVVEGIQLM
jgi:hypothetical protein